MPQVMATGTATDDLDTIAAQFEEDVERINVFTNGDETADYVTTDGRLVPSLSKVVANVEDIIRPDITAIDAAVTASQTAAGAAGQSAGAAADSAQSAATDAANAASAANAAQADAIAAADDAARAEASKDAAGAARDGAVDAQADVQQNADAARTAAINAEGSALAAQAVGEQVGLDLGAVEELATEAAGNAIAAGQSATAAGQSATNAGASATAAGQSATAAGQSATAAAASAIESAGHAAAIDPATFARPQGNLIMDPNKEIWSATSGPFTTGVYSVNSLYVVSAGAGGAATYAQAWLGTGQTVPPAILARPYVNYGRFTQTTASTGSVANNTAPLILNKIENVRGAHAVSFTFSVTLFAATPVTITSVFLQQIFGTGGSATVTTVVPVNWNVTTVAQRFSVRIDAPSLAGGTLGTARHYFQVGIYYPVGQLFDIYDTQWDLKYCSPNAPAQGELSAFDYRGPQAELARTQRYYQSLSGYLCAGYNTAGLGVFNYATLPVPMRDVPVVSVIGTPTYLNASNYSAISSGPDVFQTNIQITATGSGWGKAGLVFDSRL